MTLSTPTIYYLPGRGGRLDQGLGLALRDRGYAIVGRETVGEFQRLRFVEQIKIIADDLTASFWQPNSLVVANSFGAYLFLHAQSQIKRFPGKVLLLSPIIAGSTTPGNGPRFSPPFAERLMELAEAGQLQVSRHCEIHVGEDDWQCQPDRVRHFGRHVDVPVNLVPGSGHMLDKQYVSGLLTAWLPLRST